MKTILILLALFGLSIPVRGAEDGALSLSPAVITLRGNHGQSTTQTLTFRNGTSRAFSFDLAAQDVVIRDGKRHFADAGSIAGSIAATAVFSEKHVDVGPGETAMVTITVTLPAGTAQRAIVALFKGTNVVMSGRIPMSASLGTLLTFTASDDVALTVSPLEVRTQSAAANLGVTGTGTNTGREPIVARGVVAILDARGTLVGKSDLPPQRLMPGESMTIDGEYGGELAPDRYRVYVTYDYAGRSLSRSAEVEVK
jgi:hypothetical protein